MNSEMKLVESAWLEYQIKLLRYIRSKVRTSEEAEDILNDVFERLTKTASQNISIDNISAWLYRATKNRIIDYYRASKKHEELPDDLQTDDEEENTIKQLSNCMLPMIQVLPNNYQQAVLLSDIEGLKNKDVAAELNISLSAVKSRILRGRKMLHENLLGCCRLTQNSAGETTNYEKVQSGSPQNCC